MNYKVMVLGSPLIKVAPSSPSAAAADNIGSFRAAEDWEDALPSNLRNLLGKILIFTDYSDKNMLS